MEIQQNIANVIRAMKEIRGVYLAEFSAKLEISRSSLQEYLSGTRNPPLTSIEHLMQKFGVDPIVFLTGVFICDELQVLLIIVGQMRFPSKLFGSTRILFAQKSLELRQLWNRSADYG